MSNMSGLLAQNSLLPHFHRMANTRSAGTFFQQKLQVLYLEPGRAVECEGVCNLGGHPRPRLTHPVFF